MIYARTTILQKYRHLQGFFRVFSRNNVTKRVFDKFAKKQQHLQRFSRVLKRAQTGFRGPEKVNF